MGSILVSKLEKIFYKQRKIRKIGFSQIDLLNLWRFKNWGLKNLGIFVILHFIGILGK
jgi:hypothetical protein